MHLKNLEQTLALKCLNNYESVVAVVIVMMLLETVAGDPQYSRTRTVTEEGEVVAVVVTTS